MLHTAFMTRQGPRKGLLDVLLEIADPAQPTRYVLNMPIDASLAPNMSKFPLAFVQSPFHHPFGYWAQKRLGMVMEGHCAHLVMEMYDYFWIKIAWRFAEISIIGSFANIDRATAAARDAQFGELMGSLKEIFSCRLFPVVGSKTLPDAVKKTLQSNRHWRMADTVFNLLVCMWLEPRTLDKKSANLPHRFLVRVIYLLTQSLHQFCRQTLPQMPEQSAECQEFSAIQGNMARLYRDPQCKVSGIRPGLWCAPQFFRGGPCNQYADSWGSLLFFFVADALHNISRSHNYTDSQVSISRLWLLWIRPWRGADKKGQLEDTAQNKDFVTVHLQSYTALFRLALDAWKLTPPAIKPPSQGSQRDNKQTSKGWQDYLDTIKQTMELFANPILLDWLKELEGAEAGEQVHERLPKPEYDLPLFRQGYSAKEIRHSLDCLGDRMCTFEKELKQLQKDNTPASTGMFDSLFAFAEPARPELVYVKKLQETCKSIRDATRKFEESYEQMNPEFPRSNKGPRLSGTEQGLENDLIALVSDISPEKTSTIVGRLLAMSANELELLVADPHALHMKVEEIERSIKERKIKRCRRLWTYPQRSYESQTLVNLTYTLSARLNDMLEARPWKVADEAAAKDLLKGQQVDDVHGNRHHPFAVYIDDDGSYFLMVAYPTKDEPVSLPCQVICTPGVGFTLDEDLYFKDICELVRYYADEPYCEDSTEGAEHYLSSKSLSTRGVAGFITPVHLRFMANTNLLKSLVVVLPIVWAVFCAFPSYCILFAVICIFAWCFSVLIEIIERRE